MYMILSEQFLGQSAMRLKGRERETKVKGIRKE